jgi:HSP20 family protein
MLRPGFGSVSRDLSDLFEDFFRWPKLHSNADMDFTPRVNIREGKDDLRFVFELPGMEKNDIKVSVKDSVLTISGKRELKYEKKDGEYVHCEICNGSFSRSFTLPDYVKSDTIKADYKNGILEIQIEKLEEVKPKEIEVRVS